MTARLNYYRAAPKVMETMSKLSQEANESLEHSLVELVKLRASQINGCAFCIKMHTTDALKAGENVDRLFLLDAWRESHLYSDRERAALAWTEALTRLSETNAPDDVYQAMAEQFSAEEQVKLTMLIGVINTWNRFAVGFRSVHA